MSLRFAPFPVVAAPFGLTLGGGTEFSLHADLVQAHAELYMGLVEVGVGLIPAGGGTRNCCSVYQGVGSYEEADPFEAVKRAFKLIAMATTSGSALDARKLGFFRDRDRVTMNRDLLLADAKSECWTSRRATSPDDAEHHGRGKGRIRESEIRAWAMHEAGQISDFEVKLAHEVAYVLCGGDGPPRVVSEQDILDLERDAFVRLLGTKETQERMTHMLKTGKPLRN